MRKKILFCIAVLLFLVLSLFFSLFLAGFRFNFEKMKIEQTGGIYLKVWPQNAEVVIDGKIKKKTNPISGSLFVKNLLPREHSILVKKEGFFSWTKNLKVEPGKVAEAREILLIPKKISLQKIGGEISDFLILNGEKILVLKERNNGWEIKKLPDELLINNEYFSKNAKLVDFSLTDTAAEILLDVKEGEKQKTFLFDVEKKELKEKNATETQDFILSQDGFLFKNGERLNEIPLKVEKDRDYSIKTWNNFVFVFEKLDKKTYNLYLFNPEKRGFDKILEKFSGWALSPKKTKILFFSPNEVWIFFLSDTAFQPYKKAGEFSFLLRVSEPIEEAFWLNENYLIFLSKGEIKIAETDDRDKINIWSTNEAFDLQNKIKKFFPISQKGQIYLLFDSGELFFGKLFP